MTLKRKTGYQDEKEEDDEDMPDAARMKLDQGTDIFNILFTWTFKSLCFSISYNMDMVADLGDKH